jgi:hypothetical protein
MRRVGLAALLACAGCAVDGTQVPPGVDPAYVASWRDVQDVVWLEWAGATWGEIAQAAALREKEKILDEELLALLFMARKLQKPLEAMADLFVKNERKLQAVARASDFPRDEFFVPIRHDAPLPPGIYARPYQLHRARAEGELDNKEIGWLVVLRLAVDYFGFHPESFFDEVERVKVFESVFTAEFARAGAGGRTLEHRRVVVGDRPWVAETASRFLRQREEHTGKR